MSDLDKDISPLQQIFDRIMREEADWWWSQQEILLIHGRNDPRLEQRFLDEWDRTPPPLATSRWLGDEE